MEPTMSGTWGNGRSVFSAASAALIRDGPGAAGAVPDTVYDNPPSTPCGIRTVPVASSAYGVMGAVGRDILGLSPATGSQMPDSPRCTVNRAVNPPRAAASVPMGRYVVSGETFHTSPSNESIAARRIGTVPGSPDTVSSTSCRWRFSNERMALRGLPDCMTADAGMTESLSSTRGGAGDCRTVIMTMMTATTDGSMTVAGRHASVPAFRQIQARAGTTSRSPRNMPAGGDWEPSSPHMASVAPRGRTIRGACLGEGEYPANPQNTASHRQTAHTTGSPPSVPSASVADSRAIARDSEPTALAGASTGEIGTGPPAARAVVTSGPMRNCAATSIAVCSRRPAAPI